MKAKVDKEACIGCGLCEGICPEVFRLGDDGKAGAEDREIAEEVLEKAKDAESSCPTACITIEA